ncbi:M15 family metallopeptidase [Microbacterium sp. JB110]|uniref:M15 family metallopeptidase n=1 Tax=Microbacterium sp. JB110 TaxID=2024477 RepID=UPI000B34D3D3|nr:M15 family metallopeptidase [Microbacterium sp. JB110]RCS56955.1 D-alanyl-D-alanine carboxypeptidase family protein [Microbacterium sp. JB110]
MRFSMVTARTPLAQHRAAPRHRSALGMLMVLLIVVGGTAGAAIGHMTAATAQAPAAQTTQEPTGPATATALPAPDIDAVTAAAPCENAKVTQALDAGDPDAVIEALGGAEAFRGHVAAGSAPCIALNDGRWPWLVVNKHVTLDPIDYVPENLTAPDRRVTTSSVLRAEVTDAVNRLIADAATEGVGDIAVTSGYRSYGLQENLFNGYVNSSGLEAAEATSAHAGHSEHQTGYAVDVVPCSPGCGTMDQFGASPQGQWTAENAWKYGFIVRYEEGYTDTTGYSPEPWHLRYIGTELAVAYHEGEFHTLEDFFGLEAAPDYE